MADKYINIGGHKVSVKYKSVGTRTTLYSGATINGTKTLDPLTDDGILDIRFSKTTTGGTVNVYVNDVGVAGFGFTIATAYSAQFPVRKGDVVKFTADNTGVSMGLYLFSYVD